MSNPTNLYTCPLDKTKSLKIRYHNIGGGIKKKAPQIKTLLNIDKPDILALAEVKLAVEEFESYIKLFPNYDIYYAGHNMITLQTEYRKKHKKIIKEMNISNDEKMRKIAKFDVTKVVGKDGGSICT